MTTMYLVDLRDQVIVEVQHAAPYKCHYPFLKSNLITKMPSLLWIAQANNQSRFE